MSGFHTPLALILALAAVPVGATTQDDVLGATLRPGWQMDSGAHMAAMDLSLAPGWKTYWRSPGDAGIPPRFDWSASSNVKSVRIHWPRPSVFEVNGLQTIGYHNRLVLPLEVTAIDPARPVLLAVQVELGVCDDICLPASLTLASELTTPGAPDDSISNALAQRAETAGEAGVTRVTCTIDPIADGLRLTARLRLPDPGTPEVVAFETSDPAVWVAEAITQREGGDLVSMTEMVAPDGVPFALDRSEVTMTVLSKGSAVEVRGCPSP
ncbi:protein-disulfide reductase DsbD domain-containing protein [Tabrizicola sp.]|uniref:protein-disulfide reductase DsbD domain-containing protein n=1 Tax=Tabrizicola sp. TaxID=2005166 RepID=UPI00260C381C|nr:protein-disulfide reductase DsbD domain-containing protein [Tabrizicola sp.]MDM7933386.1 protein-disulfide reductase DsbD family protein [Tabrizicola sp.]